MNETIDFGTSSAPADVVRRQYLASARGDLEALRATLADDVEWTEMAGFPLGGTYRTPHGVTAAVMERWARNGTAGSSMTTPTSSTERTSLSSPATPPPTRPPARTSNVRVAHHFIVRGGHIVRFEQFVDTAKVREAMPA